MTSQLNVALIRKLRVSLVCLAYSLHIINVFKQTGHWQMSGRLVQELNNVCTVAFGILITIPFLSLYPKVGGCG